MKRMIVLIILGALIIGISLVGYLLSSPKETLQFTLASGVLSSLIASVVFSIILYFLLNEPVSDRAELKSLLAELEDRELKGIKTVREKHTFDPEYWLSLIREGRKELDVMGHSLAKWCEEPYAKIFAEQLISIAKSNGKVRIVILNPDGDSHNRKSISLNKSYEARIKGFINFIKKEVLNKLSNGQKNNIDIRWVLDIDLPYMYIRTDRTVVVSPYLAKTDSLNNLLLSLAQGSKYAVMYRNDFDRIFADCEVVK